MGLYINFTPDGPLSALGKARDILAQWPGARKLSETPREFVADLVVVVNNGMFDAAGWCFDKREFEEFSDPNDGRSKVWLIVPGVAELFPHMKASQEN